MQKMIYLRTSASINAEEIMVIASSRSAPIQRFLKSLAQDRIVNLCFGYPQRSILLMSNGFVLLTGCEVSELSQAIGFGVEIPNNENLPF